MALIGDFAKNPRYQGAGSSVVNPTKVDNAVEMIGQFELEIVGYVPGYHRTGPADAELESEALELAGKAEAVLLYISLDEISEAEGLTVST